MRFRMSTPKPATAIGPVTIAPVMHATLTSSPKLVALISGRAPRFNQHRREDQCENQDHHHVRQSPAWHTTARSVDGANDATASQARTATDEATSARSVRLNLHLPANSRRRVS